MPVDTVDPIPQAWPQSAWDGEAPWTARWTGLGRAVDESQGTCGQALMRGRVYREDGSHCPGGEAPQWEDGAQVKQLVFLQTSY